MSKFKVGDKVRVKSYSNTFPYIGISKSTLKRIAGNVYTVTHFRDSNITKQWYYFAETQFSLAEEMLELTEQPRREFIAIRRSGTETIAELRHDREVIKSAKSTCAPSDTFDLDTGAKLAFDRLMGREKKPITGKSFDRIFVDDIAPAPEPPKFYTGKVVMVDCEFPDRKHLINHLFEFKDGRQVGSTVRGMSFIYAPYKSFEQIVSYHNASTWTEVKSDV